MKLQAEVTGGGEGAEFALKRLTPVLVLMYLEKEDRLKCQICLFRSYAAADKGQKDGNLRFTSL